MPEATDGADVALPIAIVTQRLAHRPQNRGHSRIRDEPPVPDDGDHLFLADDTFGVGDQKAEQPVGLGFQRHDPRRSPKLGAIRIKVKWLKLQPHVEA